MKKAERKDLETKINKAIVHVLPAGQTAMPGKLAKTISEAARNIAKKFAKEQKKLQVPVKKVKKKAAPAKKAKKTAKK